ncbi:MAG: glycosyltransferase family 2 protein [Oscillospiraceae bacterium]|nr:glycosyltransferase family 2 protein [Oscillospiraceae bacterium]
MPKLSVMIPVYNVENYLSKCLDSVIYPELKDYEIVLVNDGSTDSSGDICMDYQARYPALIKVITTPNGGLGAARDVGIDEAEGEYILFLDSDDYLSPGAVPEIMETLSLDYDMCIFDVRSVNEDGRQIRYVHGCQKEGFLSLEDFPELLFEMPSAWNKIYKRRLFTENWIYYPARVWYEDMYVTPWIYTKCRKIYSVHKSWHNYLQRAGSITNNKNTARNLEIIDAVNAMLDAYRREGLYEKYRVQLEYSAFYNQVLTSVTRVNLADWKSDVQDKLIEDYIGKFPEYLHNPYLDKMPPKYRLIHFLIRHRLRFSLHCMMKLNDRIKGK